MSDPGVGGGDSRGSGGVDAQEDYDDEQILLYFMSDPPEEIEQMRDHLQRIHFDEVLLWEESRVTFEFLNRYRTEIRDYMQELSNTRNSMPPETEILKGFIRTRLPNIHFVSTKKRRSVEAPYLTSAKRIRLEQVCPFAEQVKMLCNKRTKVASLSTECLAYVTAFVERGSESESGRGTDAVDLSDFAPVFKTFVCNELLDKKDDAEMKQMNPTLLMSLFENWDKRRNDSGIVAEDQPPPRPDHSGNLVGSSVSV